MTTSLTIQSESSLSPYQRLLEDFADPRPTYRPVPFWSWNERMEADEVRRQLRLIAEAGWGGAFIHSRVGLVTPYLSEAWFAAVDAVMEAAQELGIYVWLYDEDGWPSGYSGGSVPRAAEEYRLQVLIARKVELPAPVHATPLGSPVDGIQMYTWRAQLDDPRFNGACYASLLNRDAVDQFIDDAYESYHHRYAAEYGNLIPAVFTDEPSVTYRLRVPEGAVPIADGLLEHFERMHGYDPLPHLHGLFTNAEGAKRFRLHYYRTVSDLFEQNYVRTLGVWCEKHGVSLTGHLMAEHHLYDQHSWSVNVMPMYRHFGIPGVDHLSRQVEERMTAKQCQSVANQFGKRRILSELYGMAGQGLTFADRHWIASQQIALGVNILNPHLSLYTMAGCRKRDYPPNLYYQQPWWPVNRVVDEPISRLCAAMSNGRYVAETLVIHPQDSVSALWEADADPADSAGLTQRSVSPTAPGVINKIDKLDKQFKSVLNVLLDTQRTFDLADETILSSDARVEMDGLQACLQIGQMRYPSVILPECVTLRPKTFELLQRFQEAGGLVIRCGEAPTAIDGAASPTLEKWLASLPSATLSGLPEALNVVGEPLVQFKCATPGPAPQLFVHVRDMEDASRLVFLANLDRFEERSGSLRIAGTWARVEKMDHWTGTTSVLSTVVSGGQTTVDVSIAPGQACLLRLSNEPVPTGQRSLPDHTVREEHVLDPSKWQVERLDDNALTLDQAHWSEGSGPWSREAVPVIAIQRRLESVDHTGDVRLRFVFRVEHLSSDRSLRLVMEYPDRYEIRINGQRVCYQGLEPWRDMRWLPIDIASLVHKGENVVELHLQDWRPRPVGNDAAKEEFVELESMYLVGDFDVASLPTAERPSCPAWSGYGLPPVQVRCYDGGSFCLTDPKPLAVGDTTTQGMPFYAGRLLINVPLPEYDHTNSDRFLLTAESHDGAVAEVSVDDHVLGYFAALPYEVDLTDVIRAGKRMVQVTLYGTLRNLLGPHHHAEGELPSVTPNSFLPAQFVTEDVGPIVQAWGDGRHAFTDWNDRYAVVEFGQIQQLKLVRVKSARNHLTTGTN